MPNHRNNVNAAIHRIAKVARTQCTVPPGWNVASSSRKPSAIMSHETREHDGAIFLIVRTRHGCWSLRAPYDPTAEFMAWFCHLSVQDGWREARMDEVPGNVVDLFFTVRRDFYTYGS